MLYGRYEVVNTMTGCRSESMSHRAAKRLARSLNGKPGPAYVVRKVKT
jgi:hypothetical protein